MIALPRGANTQRIHRRSKLRLHLCKYRQSLTGVDRQTLAIKYQCHVHFINKPITQDGSEVKLSLSSSIDRASSHNSIPLNFSFSRHVPPCHAGTRLLLCMGSNMLPIMSWVLPSMQAGYQKQNINWSSLNSSSVRLSFSCIL